MQGDMPVKQTKKSLHNTVTDWSLLNKLFEIIVDRLDNKT